ncbi:MAG: dATP/dGTP diphosphohydrolase domain-containing protein, partial [Plesiomonas shigelloides]
PSVKHDHGKPLMGALPANAELAVARVLTFGAEKYGRDNWRGLDDSDTRYMDAALRHINAVRRGETHDVESGEHHLAHAVCCLMFMLECADNA